jgi:serine/threonine-protein kinase RsbW
MKTAEDARFRSSACLCCQIPSRLDLVDSVCGRIQRFLVQNRLAEHCFDMELLAREFLNNAILHGNRSVVRKKVLVEISIGSKWIRLQIADQGNGFSWRSQLHKSPDDTASRGRGLLIGANYSDRMTFSRKGNRVTLWRKKQTCKE